MPGGGLIKSARKQIKSRKPGGLSAENLLPDEELTRTREAIVAEIKEVLGSVSGAGNKEMCPLHDHQT